MQAYRGKVLTGILAAVLMLTFVLSGCGNSGTNEGNGGNTGNQGSTNETANNGKTDEKPAEKVTVEFWANKFEDTTDAWFKKWTDEFNKTHENIQIKLTIVPGDAWAQKLKAAQAAGKAPDIMTKSYSGIAPAAKNGEIKPLNDLMDPAVFDDLHDNERVHYSRR